MHRSAIPNEPFPTPWQPLQQRETARLNKSLYARLLQKSL